VLFQIAMRREATEGHEAATRQIHLNQVYALAIIAPIALGYMAMAPTFEALLVPRAYRGDFVGLARDLAPGFLAYCAIYAICNPLFQLARRTWPITLAALAAFLGNLALASVPPFSRSVEGLALAHSASLILGFFCAALMALGRTQIMPRWRDLTTVAISSAAMALAIRPLNAIPSATLAAALALIVGGAIFGAALLAFDVAGLRALALAKLRQRRVAGLTAR
jgi:O-antigen/teichoic acid export membrane protein